MKATVDDISTVPEPLRGEYEERDGKFHLRIDGDLPALQEASSKLSEFRTNNIKLIKDKASLESRLKSFEGIDPAEVAEMKQRLEELQKRTGSTQPSEIEQRMRAEFGQQLTALQQQLDATEAEREQSAQRLAFRDLESQLSKIGAKIGVAESALPDFLNRGLEIFDLDGVARDGEQEIFSRRRPTEPLTMEEWAEELAQQAPHLFKRSQGGGAAGSGAAGGQRTVSTDPLEFGKNLEAIASGKARVNYDERSR